MSTEGGPNLAEPRIIREVVIDGELVEIEYELDGEVHRVYVKPEPEG